MSEPARILIIRPSALGDVCRSVPVLVSLRTRWPQAHIDWLVQDSFADAVRYHPMLSSVVEFPRRALGKAMTSGRLGAGLAFLDAVHRGQYDLVIDVQGLARSGLFAWASRAPRRIGYANAREGGWIGCNERYKIDTSLHAVDRMLTLLRAAGIEPIRDLRLYSASDARAWVRNDFRLTAGRFGVVAPTSRWPGKRWPIERFVEVTTHLLDRGLNVAVVGSESEREQCQPLTDRAREEPRILDLVGSTSVNRLMAIVEASSIVLANDSAVLHMAIGFDRPCVGLFGPTDQSLVGPYVNEREPPAVSRVEVLQHLRDGDELDHKDQEHGEEMMRRIGTREVVEAVDRVVSGQLSRGDARNHA